MRAISCFRDVMVTSVDFHSGLLHLSVKNPQKRREQRQAMAMGARRHHIHCSMLFVYSINTLNLYSIQYSFYRSHTNSIKPNHSQTDVMTSLRSYFRLFEGDCCGRDVFVVIFLQNGERARLFFFSSYSFSRCVGAESLG